MGFPIMVNTITGITFLTLIMEKSALENGKTSCPIFETNGFKKANCTNANIKEIPSNLGNIQYLDVSQNPLADISETAFIPYSSLITLHMKDVLLTSDELKIHPNAFLPLTIIEEIDLERSPFSLDENITWPQSLKTLNIVGCNVSNIYVGNLRNLEYFNGSYTELQIFPKFNKLAPLRKIDLIMTYVGFITIFDVAPFCILEFLGFTFNETQIENTTYCSCTTLDTWLFQYKVRFPDLNCQSLPGPYNCSQVMDLEPANKERRLCILKTYGHGSIVEKWEIGIVAIIAILLLLILAIVKGKPVRLPKLAGIKRHFIRSQVPTNVTIIPFLVIDTYPFEEASTSNTTSNKPSIESQ